MKILLTGSEGFIGKALNSRLTAEGHTVIGYDVKDGDISLKGSLDQLSNTGISHVFHLAARSYVPDSWKNPHDFYRVNLMGTVNVLEFCRQTGARLTYVSSYLYGSPEYLPIDEKHPVKSYNPYSHSKILAEETCQFYRDHFQTEITILRPFNIYGPGQDKKFLIPHIISQVLDPAKETVEVMDLKPKRDYLFIDDMIEALLMTLNGPPDVYNIGSGYSVSVEEIILQVEEITGIRKKIISENLPRPNEINDLYADILKAGSILNWRPGNALHNGLRKCIENSNL